MRGITLLLALALGQSAAACSGPNVGRVMAQATEFGRAHHLAVIVIFVAAALLSLRRKFLSPALAVLAAQALIHPSLVISAYGGDCGAVLKDSSFVFTLGALLAFAWHIQVLVRNAKT